MRPLFPVLLALFLLTSTVLLAATPFVTPPRPLLDTTDAPATIRQTWPKVVASSDGFLVVWSNAVPESPDLVLYAQKFSLDGNPLTPLPTLVSYGCYFPSAIESAGGYLVYANCEVDPATQLRRVIAVRLAHDARVIETRTMQGIEWINDLQTNGAETMALGIVVPHQWSMFRVDAAGNVLRTIPLWARNALVFDAFFFPSRDAWIAVRQPGDSSLWRTVVRNDISSADEYLADIPHAGFMSHATNGSSHLFVWKGIEPVPAAAAYTQWLSYVFLDADGRPLGRGETLASQFTSSSVRPPSDRPAAFWDGSRYFTLYSWFDGFGTNEIRAQEISQPQTAKPVTLERYATQTEVAVAQAAVAVGPSKSLAVWLAPKPGPSAFGSAANSTMLGRDFTTFESLEGARTKSIARTIAPEGRLRLSIDAEQTFAVWREGDAAAGIIRAQILGKTGRFSISDGIRNADAPAIERLGDIYLVAWREELWTASSRTQDRILARRYDRAGRPLDAAPILLDEGPHVSTNFEPSQDSVDVATDGAQFFVVWSRGDAQIRATRIAANGAIIDEPRIALTADALHHAWPTVEWTGREFLVVWREDPSARSLFGFITTPHAMAARTARVLANGVVRPSEKPIELPVLTVNDHASRFAAASNANETLVAWSINRLAGESCTYAQRFSLTGAPLEAVRTLRCTASTPSLTYTASIEAAWDGTEWWIVTADTGAARNAVAIPLARPSETIPFAKPFTTDVTVARAPSGLVLGYAHIDETQFTWRLFVQSLLRSDRRRAAR